LSRGNLFLVPFVGVWHFRDAIGKSWYLDVLGPMGRTRGQCTGLRARGPSMRIGHDGFSFLSWCNALQRVIRSLLPAMMTLLSYRGIGFSAGPGPELHSGHGLLAIVNQWVLPQGSRLRVLRLQTWRTSECARLCSGVTLAASKKKGPSSAQAALGSAYQ
jgi:hypothetical protein